MFGLSYLLAGVVATVFNVTSSILQPLFGHWFDRTHVPWLLEAGLAVNCLGMSLLGFSSSYVLLLFLVGSAGLGTAAFHPPAFSSIVRSNESSKGRAMGGFLSAGNTGYFLGPFVAGALGSAFGLTGMLCLLPLGLVVSVLLYRFSRKGIAQTHQVVLDHQIANKRLVGLLAVITILRSITVQTTVTFLPLYFVARGQSLLVATGIASVWLGVCGSWSVNWWAAFGSGGENSCNSKFTPDRSSSVLRLPSY